MIVSTISPATGPLLVAAFLLVAAGAAKLSRPAPTALALARLGLPGSDPAVRTLGLVEIAAAALAITFGARFALPLALLYLGFATVTAAQLRAARTEDGAADCGCFGDHAAPVDGTHLAVNVLAAAAAATAALTSADGLAASIRGGTGPTLVLVLLAVTGAVAVRALLTEGARVRALVRAGVER